MIKMNQLYNEHIKEEFLRSYDNHQTQNTIKYILYKSYSIEKILNKDLGNFNINEIGQVISSTNPLNVSVGKTNLRFIQQYLKWYSSKGLRISNILPLDGIDVNEWVEQFIPKRKLYFSETEINHLISKLVNYQDKAIIRMLFEGINGHACSELTLLRESDVNNGLLKLNDAKFESREVAVTSECLNLIKGALYEKEYLIRNGTVEKGAKEIKLVENDYVIRPVSRKVTDTSAPADKHTVYRRLAVIGELFDLPYLTVKNIERSGMIKMAADLLKKHGSLEYPQLEMIGDRFGIRRVMVNGYHTYNTTILREYLNEQNIMELYPEVGTK
jgi:hypothetical protein